MTVLIWEGIEIALSHHARRYGDTFDHIELQANERLPVSETGYRSLFIHHEELALWDSPEAFVLEWLSDAARHPSWQDYRQQSRQLNLF